MRVVIYARVSTDEQRERESILTQLTLVREYCVREGHDIVEEYLDDGVSGSIPLWLRPAGSRLLADMEEKRFDAVVVYRTDRLGRETSSAFTALSMIEGSGVAFLSATESYGQDPMGATMRDMNVVFAAHERRVIAKRVTDAMYRHANEGKWTGGVRPYGYRVVDGYLMIDEPEAAIIRRIYTWINADRLSTRRIAERLNLLNIPTAAVTDGRTAIGGKTVTGKWSSPRIYQIATNPLYKGEWTYGKGGKHRERQPIVRMVPAIVDVETWDQTQTTLANNLRFSPRNAKHIYLLRGLIRCGSCGRMWHGAKSRHGRVFYRCNTRHHNVGNGRECSSGTLSSDIEAAIWMDIERYLYNPQHVLSELAEKMEANGDIVDGLRSQHRHVEAEIASKADERDRILAIFSKGIITESDLQRRLTGIADEEAALRQQLKMLDAEIQQADTVRNEMRTAETYLTSLRSALDRGLDIATKRSVIEALVEGIIVEANNTARVIYRFSPPITSVTGCRR